MVVLALRIKGGPIHREVGLRFRLQVLLIDGLPSLTVLQENLLEVMLINLATPQNEFIWLLRGTIQAEIFPAAWNDSYSQTQLLRLEILLDGDEIR